MSINRITLLGNVGKIETRFTAGGDPVVNLSLAVSETWKDKQSGEKKEKTTWVRCVLFGFPAKFAADYVSVGNKLYLEGKWTNREWANSEGIKQYSTECVIDGFGKIEQLTPKSDNATQPYQPAQNIPNQAQTVQHAPQQTQTGQGFYQPQQSENNAEPFEPDQDIPFN